MNPTTLIKRCLRWKLLVTYRTVLRNEQTHYMYMLELDKDMRYHLGMLSAQVPVMNLVTASQHKNIPLHGIRHTHDGEPP